jgi:RsiW-degrading membrane proteinase PrsW (M82 family)
LIRDEPEFAFIAPVEENNPMLETMLQQFKSFYTFPGLSFKWILLGIALALVFGAVWLVIYRVWRFSKLCFIATLLASAVLTWSAIAFIQLPLQTWTQNLMLDWFGQATFIKWLLLIGIPFVLISGLVQEGAKLIPVIALWFSRKKQLDPLTGLYAGAISGAGFGIFEAAWVHNMMFASGWSWQVVSISGPTALLDFWERFFSVGFHIAVSALAGYGWAKGLKWQYFLIAAGLHGLSNYSVVLLNKGTLDFKQIEIYIAVLAIAVTVYAFLVMRKCTTTPVAPPIVEETSLPEAPENP